MTPAEFAFVMVVAVLLFGSRLTKVDQSPAWSRVKSQRALPRKFGSVPIWLILSILLGLVATSIAYVVR